MLKKILSYLNSKLFYIWLLFFAFCSTMMSPENSLIYGFFGLYLILYLSWQYSVKLFRVMVSFIAITLALYSPIRLHYGSLNSGIIAAFFETNPAESFGFLKGLHFKDFIFSFLYLFVTYILFRLESGHQKSPTLPGNKRKETLLNGLLIFAAFFSVTWYPTKAWYEAKHKELSRVNQGDEFNNSWSLTMSPVNVISFYANIYDSIRHYYKDKSALEAASYVKSPWTVEAVNPQYKNYVLVIGESARKDYFSAYGFPLQTSPFLNTTKGFFNSGYISSAPGTYHSLLNSLYLNKLNIDGSKNYGFNIITLAKSAGIQTTWLSNQGSIGRYDTVSSRLGMMANQHQFTKKGGFNTSTHDDNELLPLLKQALAEKNSNTQPRLIILHMMGSHQPFCHLVKKEEQVFNFINKNVSCYVDTILKTDKFLQSTINILKEQGQSYSLIYFSDHGLSHTTGSVQEESSQNSGKSVNFSVLNKEESEKLTLDYNGKFKQNYEVPFIKLSSDDTERQEVNVKRSAFHFIDGFAQWLGIKAKELNQNYDFFSSQNDAVLDVFNFKKKIPFSELKDDPIPKVAKPISDPLQK